MASAPRSKNCSAFARRSLAKTQLRPVVSVIMKSVTLISQVANAASQRWVAPSLVSILGILSVSVRVPMGLPHIAR